MTIPGDTLEGSSPHTRGARRRFLAAAAGLGIIPAYAGSTFRRSSDSGRMPDHPRIRGEHLRFQRVVLEFVGSSPHTRGARRSLRESRGCSGIIPAYAGSTRRLSRRRGRRADHPRIRGEHLPAGAVTLGAEGSSPHTRGARRSDDRRRAGAPDHPRIRGEHILPSAMCAMATGSSPHTRGALIGEEGAEIIVRIIPAYAGSTRHQPRQHKEPTDHPRIRGEHRDMEYTVGTLLGSSPHTRGAHRGQLRTKDRAGIIPAYAGSTYREIGFETIDMDHPRIRGEHSMYSNLRTAARGSSPHTRGAHPVVLRHGDRLGIIPAYAGSTCRSAASRPSCRDHPRIRGEHRYVDMAAYRLDGSSPHTRGALSQIHLRARYRRIIPAYAGSTRRLGSLYPAPRDHPRIRGEHPGPAPWLCVTRGSSPHTRGAPMSKNSNASPERIIPAYAGSTIRWKGKD